MTEFADYPMALYPPKGEMLIVNNEQEHLDAVASWEPVAVAVEPVAEPAIEQDSVEPDDDGPEVLDDAGVPIKRGPGRPRKVIP